MEQRDLIKDEIERMSRALGQLLNRLLSASDPTSLALTTQTVEKEMKKLSGLNWTEMVTWTDEEIRLYVKKNPHLHPHLAAIGNVLYEMVMMENEEQTLSPLVINKLLVIYHLAQEGQKNYDFALHERINTLQALLHP
jgi:site-specific recombinase